MRILQLLTAPRGVLGLTLLALALAFMALVLDQADYKSPALVWVFGILAGITALGTLFAFFGLWIRGYWTWAKGFFRLLGYPLLCGLLLGGIEWIVSASLYSALGIGAATYVLTQVASGFWLSRHARGQRRVQELTEENEQLDQLSKNLRAEYDSVYDLQRDTGRDNTKLRQENQELRRRVEELTVENRELTIHRDGQLRSRFQVLSDSLQEFLEGWEQGDPENQEALRRYKEEFSGEVVSVINDMKTFGLRGSQLVQLENLERLRFPECRGDVEKLHGALHLVGRFGFY